MKTVMIVLSLLSLIACTKEKKEPVDTTRTTSAIIVQPTLNDSHAAEPNATDQNYEENVDQNMDMDVDEVEMSGARDAGATY